MCETKPSTSTQANDPSPYQLKRARGVTTPAVLGKSPRGRACLGALPPTIDACMLENYPQPTLPKRADAGHRLRQAENHVVRSYRDTREIEKHTWSASNEARLFSRKSCRRRSKLSENCSLSLLSSSATCLA